MSSCTARVGVLGSQLFRAAGNTETGFTDLISIAFIKVSQCEDACLLLGDALYWKKKKPGNHLSKRVHVRASRGPAHIGVAVRVLIWTVSA